MILVFYRTCLIVVYFLCLLPTLGLLDCLQWVGPVVSFARLVLFLVSNLYVLYVFRSRRHRDDRVVPSLPGLFVTDLYRVSAVFCIWKVEFFVSVCICSIWEV